MPYMNFKINVLRRHGLRQDFVLHSHFIRNRFHALTLRCTDRSHFRGNTAACFRISADMDARNAKAWNGIPAKLPMIWQTF